LHHYYLATRPSFTASTIPTFVFSFFFTHPPTTDIYTLSLHDALPILLGDDPPEACDRMDGGLAVVIVFPSGLEQRESNELIAGQDRKSTRLNSSHRTISYAVFCLKKKKKSIKDRVM